ncbi:SAM-dependent methyltransferase [Carbonactinospora thermoautotrophica]|uniref:BREX-2 system adenine-specific DNA-methyltransferase PglX n=1 Tax=Carbonactinospora thermoautotrophica TaxID=1469144 RepID=UPI00226DEA87|nr:BREX-2 system adenine-specific DNA-methyltransferase PglX [Carbonactinospora thermoautotrophica]MCX9191368.1 SAM-dependent methyltransferase [Carbonactinospora thermoautotrophica]
MIDREALLRDLRGQVRALEADLWLRSEEVEEFATALRREWQAAREAKRTAATYESWRDERVTQAAVAWVLGTVFVRFCEDNGLIELPYLAGPGDRLALAVERQTEYFQKNPSHTDRDWIVAGFDAMSAAPVAAKLFDRAHNPMWQVTPSHDAAKALLAFWRRRDERGEVVYDFTDPEWDTRFLGDLYQDLSEHARKTYALLQTPEFVEEFILDRTLKPAIDEFGLEGLRLIDPACGSGHFLLGAFHRLLAKWEDKAPNVDRWELIARALKSVHGVDKNPFAVAIARFRLLVAAMKAGGVKRLDKAPEFPINVAVGDSLLHGRGAPGVMDFLDGSGPFMYFPEDVGEYIKSVDILGLNSYHVVVGNPPYITVKDKQENKNYRKGYPTCSGTYALSVPFAERFFRLARAAGKDSRGAGYVGQITTNSFMKREFGKKLIEEFFAHKVELTHIIDTSGAYIPGHGTPTVILIGRNRVSKYGENGQVDDRRPVVRTVMGVRGEPKQPENPADGLVWRAIIGQIDQPNSESEWVSVADLPRELLSSHPWSLAGGGAVELQVTIERRSGQKLKDVVESIGRTTATGEDDLYFLPDRQTAIRLGEGEYVREIVVGDAVRDFAINKITYVRNPYRDWANKQLIDEGHRLVSRSLWPGRSVLERRIIFGKTLREQKRPWFCHLENYSSKLKTSYALAFAFVATHNHFAFDRSGRLFNRTSPMVKLSEEATEDNYLSLLGALNSSTACFWLKQVSYPKGGDPIGNDGARVSAEAWSDRYEFTGTKLEQFPLPAELPLEFGRSLDALAQRLAALEPAAICAEGTPTRQRLDEAKAEHARIRGRMIALQEELDWEVYRLYGLLDETEAAELRADSDIVPELNLGERAFEIVLARKMARGEVETQWFARHGSTPITEIPAHWPEAYRRVVAKRIEVIENRRDIALIERPECKRRWAAEPWEKKEKEALRTWLLDRCEDRDLWYAPDEYGTVQPRPMTVNRLADRLRKDPDVVSVARLYAGPDADLADVLAEIVEDEHVPYLAALRYTEEGLRTRAQWEHVWDLQRKEDATGERLDIPVPPKYKSTDFRKASYWRNRGKLDVPKERFISYPLASPDADQSLLLGWAGWDHREQAHALMTLIEERSGDGWEADRLTPLIAGLAEVLPWVRQWHGEVDPEYGTSPAEAYAAYLEEQQLRHGLGDDALRAWRLPAPARGRRARKW